MSTPETPDLREQLAALEHEQWAQWTAHMLQAMGLLNAHPVQLLERFDRTQTDSITRWQRQLSTPYVDLSEKEKDSDREWADKVLALANPAKLKDLAAEVERLRVLEQRVKELQAKWARAGGITLNYAAFANKLALVLEAPNAET